MKIKLISTLLVTLITFELWANGTSLKPGDRVNIYYKNNEVVTAIYVGLVDANGRSYEKYTLVIDPNSPNTQRHNKSGQVYLDNIDRVEKINPGDSKPEIAAGANQPADSSNSNPSNDSGQDSGNEGNGNGGGRAGDLVSGGIAAATQGAILGGIGGDYSDALKDLNEALLALNNANQTYIENHNQILSEGSEGIFGAVKNSTPGSGAGSSNSNDSIDGSIDGSRIGSDEDNKSRATSAYNKFRSVKPKTLYEIPATSLLAKLFEFLDFAFNQLPPELVAFALDFNTLLAQGLVDYDKAFGGMIPVVSPAVRLAEGITGFDMSNGQQLNDSQRLDKIVEGFIDSSFVETPGVLDKFDEVIDEMKKFGKFDQPSVDILKEGFQKTKNTLNDPAVRGKNGLRYDNMTSVDPAKANLGYGKAPWPADKGAIVEGTSKSDMTFVRFHGNENSAVGEFVSTYGINGRTPSDFKNGFSLRDDPSLVSITTVPAGSRIRFGPAAAVDGWGEGGLIQHQVISSPSSLGGSGFKPVQITVPIKDILKADGTFDTRKIRLKVSGKSL